MSVNMPVGLLSRGGGKGKGYFVCRLGNLVVREVRELEVRCECQLGKWTDTYLFVFMGDSFALA